VRRFFRPELEAVGCIKTDIPSLGERAVGIIRSVIILGTIEKWVQKIFASEGKLPIVGDSLGNVEV
jgi:hypothetical protein